jgi:uncharacterized membrane protein SpoIIM required for sporulation
MSLVQTEDALPPKGALVIHVVNSVMVALSTEVPELTFCVLLFLLLYLLGMLVGIMRAQAG